MNNSNISAVTEWWNDNNGLLMYYHSQTFVERISWFGEEGFLSFPVLIPMWYVRDLIVLVMLSPLIYWAVQKKLFLIIVLIIYVSGVYPFIPGLSPSPLLFFSTGMFLSIKGYGLIDSLRRYRYPAYAIFVALWIILIPLAGYRTAEGSYFYPFFIISGVVSILSIISFYVTKEELLNQENRFMSIFRKNENKCFFIYAAHTLIQPYVCSILDKMCMIITNNVDVSTIPFAEQYPVLLIGCYIVKMLIVISLCIIFYNLIQRYTPKFCRILNGR